MIGAPVLGWSAAALGCGRRGDRGVGADVLRDEIGVAAEAIAGAFDLDHDGVVEEPVEERGCDDRITEHLAPLGEAAVRGEE